ncbi:hypothetical protein RDI58_015723 [Solanum bulbocastanum]|uniref:Protein kinase domain-containing protein n=1 Tax=Solanum bulbocastanum TaxID=147425 RepID=A0AAN8YF94_SOLBU
MTPESEMEKKIEVEIMWKRVRILGKIRSGFVSLAFTNHSALNALKSCIFTQEDGILLYNMLLEYASAGSLAHRNNDKLGLPEFQVQKYTKDVLLGLSFIHGKGIIHCDIKPHNILLTSNDDDIIQVIFPNFRN